MIVIRDRVIGSLARLAISTAKREIDTVTRKLREYPIEMISKDAPERIAIAYLESAIAQVKERRPRL